MPLGDSFETYFLVGIRDKTLYVRPPGPCRKPQGDALLTSAQEVIELAVFRSFAEVCPLNIVPDSIEKRRPPHPDIWCVVKGCGPVAFELAEIVDPAFLRQVDGTYDLRRKFKRACEGFPKVKKTLQNATVHIEFYQNVSKNKRMSSIEPILEVLASPHSLDSF
jgi:hypothetical protein